VDREGVLPPATMDVLFQRYRVPLAPCLPFLHKKFRDPVYIGKTSYEGVLMFLEERRMERQKTGPEEIRDWQQILSKKHVKDDHDVSITSQLQLVNINPTVAESRKPHLLRCKNWSEREEARLVGELRKGLGRQLVDRSGVEGGGQGDRRVQGPAGQQPQGPDPAGRRAGGRGGLRVPGPR
jgi:hypothetical protein